MAALRESRRFNKAIVHRCLSLVGRKNCGRQPYGRKKIAGGNILAVSYECKAEIYRQKKTTIPGENLGTKIGRKERGSFQLYKVEDGFWDAGPLSKLYASRELYEQEAGS